MFIKEQKMEDQVRITLRVTLMIDHFFRVSL